MYGKEINIIDKQNASEASILLKNFASLAFWIVCSLPSLVPAKTTHLPIHFPLGLKITGKQFGSENRVIFWGKSRLRVGRNA